MKSSTVFRLVLAAFAVGFALLGSGCGTPQRSIPPNWYDSYYYKGGQLVVPELPQSSPATGIWDQ